MENTRERDEMDDEIVKRPRQRGCYYNENRLKSSRLNCLVIVDIASKPTQLESLDSD